MLRWLRPRRVLELGPGARASSSPRALTDSGHHRVIDPFPSALLAEAGRPVELHRISTYDAPLAWFTDLHAGDVLFADTTHVVKPGGDVKRLVLEVLPQLRSGVVVHIHDVFWPFPYPRHYYEEAGFYWQKQELVQALLVENPRWEILLANHAAWRFRRDRMQAVFPVDGDRTGAAALWLRRR